MAFTTEDFTDLVRLMQEHPEWRAQLRALLLSEEILELPIIVRQLVEAQLRTEQRLEQLTEAQARTEQRLEQLTARVENLAQHGDRLAAILDRHTIQLGRLEGWHLEARYQRYAHAIFTRLAPRVRVLDPTRLARIVDDAAEQSLITERERREVLWSDVVMAAKRSEDRADIYIIAEVSVTIDLSDVTRAMRRAAILQKLGRPALAVVAGERINDEALSFAEESGVHVMLNGHIESEEASA